MSDSTFTVGLKRMRSNPIDERPKYSCDNCQCLRYSTCTCKRKTSKRKKVQHAG